MRPDGRLLVVEATERLTVAAARELTATGISGPRRRLLATWAAARAGSSVPAALYDRLRATERRTEPLLGGLAAAHVFRKPGGGDDVKGRTVAS